MGTPVAPSATTGDRYGTYELTINITIKSAIPTSQPIYCWLGVQPVLYSLFNYDTAQKTATRSGNTATCKVTIPYSWSAIDVSSASVLGANYTVFTGSMVAATAVPLARYVAKALPTVTPVPGNGVKTSRTVAVTL
jgi:hypothetical protein